ILHITSDTPDLNWSYSDPEGVPQTEYDVRVGTESGGSDMWAPGVVAGVQTNTTYAGSALVDGTDYYFGVRVSDGDKWSNWTEVMFHTNAPPSTPTLLSPEDGSIGLTPGTITLDWTGVTDPDGDSITYYWYLSTVSDFSTIEDSGTVTSTSEDVVTQEETTYYWLVRAWDGYEFGGDSATFQFTTGARVGSITGTVVRDSDDEPIQEAKVELLDANDEVIHTDTTDANGDFEFMDLDFGTYSVRVTKSGYETHLEEGVAISFTDPHEVLEIRLTEKPKVELDWMLILIPLIIIIIIVIVLLILLKRRKKPAEVPPVAVPPAYQLPPEQPPAEMPPEQPTEQLPEEG
ncbi:MAG: carboxypeptidase regulatory-like domain-containing protein, partial [Thermoplasmata archaeon]